MKYEFLPYKDYVSYPASIMKARAIQFFSEARRRRTVRDFSDAEVPKEIIENCIKAAGLAPSGANKQPWHFVIVASEEKKKEIRIAAEKEEQEFYNKRAPKDWLDDLEHLGTDENKPFLEKAPYLIAVFEKKYDISDDNEKLKNYYTKESVGIATGFLLMALHHCGLASLTHTPSPMNFLNKILDRPQNEKPYMLIVTGLPEEDVKLPNITKKSFDEIASYK